MTFIIAEAGSNHNGNFKQALALIDAASRAKADAIKFQTFAADTLFSKFSPDYANYKDIRGIIRENEIPRKWHKELKSYCDDNSIEFMSTPFDEAAVDQLVEVGVKKMKVAGFESGDPRFLGYVARANLPMIVSIGIGMNYDDVDHIMEIIRKYNNKSVTLLHCNNAYPTPYDDINLDSMRMMNGNFDIGLSDHTPGILIPPVAVGMGAVCIEKHFTLSKELPGPDHHFAIDSYELKQMVENIRIVERAIRLKKQIFTTSEKDFKIGTRSVVARRDLPAGTILSEDNVTTKRPCTDGAISASDYFLVLGKTLKSDIVEDEILKWTMIN